MTKNTELILRATLKADGTIPDQQITDALAVLRGGQVPNGKRQILPLLLNQAQAAELGGFSRFTMARMRKSGRIRPVEVLPGFFKYRRADIENMAAQ
jgi:hypothetical protein